MQRRSVHAAGESQNCCTEDGSAAAAYRDHDQCNRQQRQKEVRHKESPVIESTRTYYRASDDR
jgi:hypothetical protein